jgi:hypothetical protein
MFLDVGANAVWEAIALIVGKLLHMNAIKVVRTAMRACDCREQMLLPGLARPR